MSRAPSPPTRLRRASEVAEFVYCQRAWWLHQVQGHAPQNLARLEQGTRAHEAYGRQVRGAAWVRRLAWGVALLAGGLLLAALLGWR